MNSIKAIKSYFLRNFDHFCGNYFFVEDNQKRGNEYDPVESSFLKLCSYR